MRIWLNDGLVDLDQASVPVTDHGFTVGDGVFETMKVQNGVPFALRRHLLRMERSCAAMRMAAPSRERVEDACRTVAAQVPDGPHRLRVTYTAGPGPFGSARGPGPGTLVVAAVPTRRDDRPAVVAVAPWVRNERGATAGVKSTSYAENVIALDWAAEHGADEALLADTTGRLCEGTGSNVVVVVDGVATTPTLGTGALAGVTRELLLEWTDVREADLRIEDLPAAAEIALLSSTRSVQPVGVLRYGPAAERVRELDAPGPVTAELSRAFEARAAEASDP